MSERQASAPVPEPLERYAEQFDGLFSRVNQRDGFRRYLVGLLLSAERNKTLTACSAPQFLVLGHFACKTIDR